MSSKRRSAFTSDWIAAASAFGTARWCSTATGACSQRPTQGASSTRTSAPSSAGSFSISARAPASSHDSPLHTRSVSLGGAA